MRVKKTFNNFIKENRNYKIPKRIVEVEVSPTVGDVVTPPIDFSCISLPVNNKLDAIAKNLIYGKNVIVVDPSYMDLTQLRGKEIDSYDLVIRINHLPDNGGILGSRCDLLYLDDKHISIQEGIRGGLIKHNIQHIRSKTYISLPNVNIKCSYWSNRKKNQKVFGENITDMIYIIAEIISFKPSVITLSNFVMSLIKEPTKKYLSDKIKNSVLYNRITNQNSATPISIIPPKTNNKPPINNFIHNRNDHELYAYVNGKNVIIVGPSPINSGLGIGKIIDQYDVVIKTNGGFSSLPKEDYGARCDILYANIFFSQVHQGLDSCENIKFIRSKAHKNVDKNDIKFSSWSNLAKLNKKYSFNILTGLYVVEEMLNWGANSVTITGMDFYETDDPYIKNYLPKTFTYDSKSSDRIHNYKKHAEIFKRYINDGVIINLNYEIKKQPQMESFGLLFNGVVKINEINILKENNLTNIHIAIPTYNRPDLLLNLLNQIYLYHKYYNISVYIYDDASSKDYSIIYDFMKRCGGMRIQFKQNANNLGKKLYSMVYNNIFYDVMNSNADYYIQIPDDVDLVDDFFNRCISSISKTKEDVISILICKFQHKKMNNKNIIKMGDGEYYATNWLDGAYIARKSFFSEIGYKINVVNPARWAVDPTKGSGTGGQIRAKYKKRPIYQLTNSLIIHKGLDFSAMCNTTRNMDYTSILSVSDMIKNRRVIFVGPSPNLLENGDSFGKFIDGFDVIIRTNGSYPIPLNLQPYMGTRTDILSLNKAFQHSNNFKNIAYNDSEISYFYDMGSLYKKNTNLPNILRDVLFFDENNLQKIQQRINEHNIQPFGGMVIVEEILKYNPKELYIVGVSNYGNENHHFNGYLPDNLKPEDVIERQERFHANGSYHQGLYFKNLLNNNLIKMDDVSIKNFQIT